MGLIHDFECTCRWLGLIQKGKEDKIPLIDDKKDKLEKLQANLQKAILARETAKTNDDRIKAANNVEAAKAHLKEVMNAMPWTYLP